MFYVYAGNLFSMLQIFLITFPSKSSFPSNSNSSLYHAYKDSIFCSGALNKTIVFLSYYQYNFAMSSNPNDKLSYMTH